MIGSSSRTWSMVASSKLITARRPPDRAGCPATASTTASAAARAFTSITRPMSAGSHSRISPRVGTFCPLPASALRISSMVMSATRPVRSVVRSSVSSWITASWPSEVRWTSSSTASAPISTPMRNDSRVFSGAYRGGATMGDDDGHASILPASASAAEISCSGVPSGTPRSSQMPISRSTNRDAIAI